MTVNCGLAVLIATLAAACADESTNKHYVYFTHENIICQDFFADCECHLSQVAFAKCAIDEKEKLACTVSGWGPLFEDQGLKFVPTLIWKENTLVGVIKRTYSHIPNVTVIDWMEAYTLDNTLKSTNATADALPKETSRAACFLEDAILFSPSFWIGAFFLSILMTACAAADQLLDVRKAIPTIAYNDRMLAWDITFSRHLDSADAMQRLVGLVVLACFANLLASGNLVYAPSERKLTLYCTRLKTKKEEPVAAVEACHCDCRSKTENGEKATAADASAAQN
jgi:hypothetical protein